MRKYWKYIIIVLLTGFLLFYVQLTFMQYSELASDRLEYKEKQYLFADTIRLYYE